MRMKMLTGMLAATLTLAACGEGGTGGTGLTSPGADTKILNVGIIESLSNQDISIAGHTYHAAGAALRHNGEAITRETLESGMVARFVTDADLPDQITQLDVNDMVVGAIERVGGSTVVVQGQMIKLTSATRFAGNLLKNDMIRRLRVAVMGLTFDHGILTATHVAVASAEAEDRSAGIVSARMGDYDVRLGTLSVHFAADVSAPPVGTYVEVQGRLLRDGTFEARRWRAPVDEFASSDGARRLELEGYVSALTDADFGRIVEVWGKPIRIDSATITEGILMAGAKIHLWAQWRDTQWVAVRAIVENVDGPVTIEQKIVPSATSMVRAGSLDLLRQTFQLIGLENTVFSVDERTQFVGHGIASLSALREGYTVVLRVRASANSAPWLLDRVIVVERGFSEDVQVFATLADVDFNGAKKLNSVKIFDTIIDGKDIANVNLNANVATGTKVELQGKYLQNTLQWNEIGAF